MTRQFEAVAVIGLGYIGLPTAAILASRGIRVTGVDVKNSSIEAVNRGEVPFVEPELGDFLREAVAKGFLSAQRDTPRADAYMVAVPTPFGEEREPDLSFVDAAADGIAQQLNGGELIVLESTCPPGATERLADRILGARPDLDQNTESQRIHIAHCPERVLPGQVMKELVTNDRIIGGLTREAAERAKALYETFCEGKILLTDARTAEMAKLVENAYRDVNIAFANELSVLADKLDIDVWELIELANHHPRVNILQPGPGVGGHCISVDPWFIVSALPDETPIIRTAREVNDAKPEVVLSQIVREVEASVDPIVAILGLTFKANIDDLRESPALKITADLARQAEIQLLVVEPNIATLPNELIELDHVRLSSIKESVETADIIVMLVDHDEFKSIREEELKEKRVVDTRGVWRTRSSGKMMGSLPLSGNRT